MANDPDLESAYALETPEDNLKLYRTWAESYDAEFVEGTTYRFPEVVTRTYLEAGGGWPCLDVGCGTGALAEHFAEDAVIDGETGILVDPESVDELTEAVLRLLDDPEAARRMGEAGRARVERELNWTAFAATVAKLCETAQ